MTSLDDLLSDLASLDAQHDLDGMLQLRERIVAEHPDSDAAVEAMYKIGLDFLFRSRQLASAVKSFEAAAKRKHPFWSAAARTSLGLCLYHQGRTQKALFELRRVAYPEQPSVHSVTALAFMENIFESEGNREEVSKARKDRVGQLRALIDRDATPEASERGYHLLQLGLALRDQGQDEEAMGHFQAAKDMGPESLGADLYRSIIDAMS